MFNIHSDRLSISVSVLTDDPDNDAGPAAALFNNVAKAFGLDAAITSPDSLSPTTAPDSLPSLTGGQTADPPPPAAPTSPIAAGERLAVQGADGVDYTLNVAASDRITNCADHAYGAAMVTFLRNHSCGNAHRILATLDVDGREAVLSVITVSFPPSQGDTYGYQTSIDFQKLEKAAGTGSLNDLLREGRYLPRIATSIPRTEAFVVTGEDASNVVFDAWWVHGATRDQDPSLTEMEGALYKTAATPFD